MMVYIDVKGEVVPSGNEWYMIGMAFKLHRQSK